MPPRRCTSGRALALWCLIGAAPLLLVSQPVAQGGAALNDKSTGEAIMRETERVNQQFIGERIPFTMILINAQGDRTERRFTLEIREDQQDGNQSRLEFDWPENVRGTILLTHTHKNVEDDQWLYLPAAKRVRRIAAANKSGTFMGSEFTYEDLAPFEFSKYTYQRLPDETVDGKACYRVERKSVRESTGYSRTIVALSKDALSPVTLEYYDRKGDLLKVARYREEHLVGKYHRHQLLRMENVQTRRVSELRAGPRQLGITIDAQRFRSQALGQ